MGKISFIEKEKNSEKRKMLYSVFMSNEDYAKTKTQKMLLQKILKGMAAVDRKGFVLEDDVDNAYLDTPLAIGWKQTISQPSTVAHMLMLAELRSGQEVLEIGSGSGWNASLMAFLVNPGKVTSIERVAPLSELARKNFSKLPGKVSRKMKLEFIFGNGLNSSHQIWKKKYDLIIVTAAGSSELIRELKKIAKLKDGGMLLFPTADGNMELWKSKKGRLLVEHIEQGYAFVPLVK